MPTKAIAEQLFISQQTVHTHLRHMREKLGARNALHLLAKAFLFQDDFPKDSRLTRREQEIILLLIKGSSSKDSAEELHISRETVRTHRQHIREKLGVRNSRAVLASLLDSSGTEVRCAEAHPPAC